MTRFVTAVSLLCASVIGVADINQIDTVRHDAPHLAQFGSHDVGVRTLTMTDKHRADALNTAEGSQTIFADRALTVEVWYPAKLQAGQQPGGSYRAVTRNPAIVATLHGKAVRDANRIENLRPAPLIIISHGYPGNRYLMAHMAENLASKGYVVASIDHRGSTYTDQQPVTGSLYDRPLDQDFAIDRLLSMSARPGNFFTNLVDADNIGAVGYSMGGYGLIINLGGGYSDVLTSHELAPPNDLAQRHAAANPDYHRALSSNIKAAIAIAPWGMSSGVWNPNDLDAIRTPMFFVAGSVDDTAGYEDGVRALFEHATGSDRYLLTFANAGHSVAAPIPLPIELARRPDLDGAAHYTDPVWDTIRMNNIVDHFATAFFDYRLKGDASRLEYLDSAAKADALPGFAPGTSHGLTLEHRAPAE